MAIDIDEDGRETGSVIAALQVIQMVLEQPKRNGDVGAIIDEVSLSDRMLIYDSVRSILKKFVLLHRDTGHSISHLKSVLERDTNDKRIDP